MADGYGFGGEGDWKTAALLRRRQGDGRRTGRAARSFMEDYTYHFGPGEPKILGAHMLEVCPSIAADTPSCEIHPLGIGDREDPVRLVFDAAPGPATVIGLVDLGDRFRLVANDDRGRPARRAAAEAAGRPRGVEARAVAVDLGRAVAHRGRPAPHGAHRRRRRRDAAATSPRWCTPSCS